MGTKNTIRNAKRIWNKFPSYSHYLKWPFLYIKWMTFNQEPDPNLKVSGVTWIYKWYISGIYCQFGWLYAPIPPFFREPGNSLHWLLEDFPPLTWVLTWRLLAGQFPIDSIGFRIIDSTGPYIDANRSIFIIYLNLNHRPPKPTFLRFLYGKSHGL